MIRNFFLVVCASLPVFVHSMEHGAREQSRCCLFKNKTVQYAYLASVSGTAILTGALHNSPGCLFVGWASAALLVCALKRDENQIKFARKEFDKSARRHQQSAAKIAVLKL